MAHPLPADLTSLQGLALERNPSLSALRAAAGAAAAEVPAASTRPDPIVMIGAMNVGLRDLDTSMPASMVPSIQVTQTLPFFGKQSARAAIAGSTYGMALQTLAEAEWQVRVAVAESFHTLRALDSKLDVQRRTLELLDELLTLARARYASGMGRQTDILRAEVEVARTDADLARLEARRVAEAATLASLLDVHEPAAIGELRLPEVPDLELDVEVLQAQALRLRPLLLARAEAVERARSANELSRREFWPDLTVSAQLGRGGGANPRTMGGIMVGASIPVQRASKQGAARTAAEARALQATAEETQARALVTAEIHRVVADLRRSRRLLRLYRDDILPTAEANVTSALAAYRAGDADFATVVDAQLAALRFEQEFEDLVAEHGVAVERLAAAVGGRIAGLGDEVSDLNPTDPPPSENGTLR